MFDVREAGRAGGAGMSFDAKPAWERGRVGVGGGRGACVYWYWAVRDCRDGLERGTAAGVVFALSELLSGRVEAPEIAEPVFRFLLRTVTEDGIVVVVERGVGVEVA